MRNLKKNLLHNLKKPLKIFKNFELWAIRSYQKIYSLDHGYLGRIKPNLRNCKFTPTCSEYGYEAIKRYGIVRGNYLTVKRILSCNPWSKPGRYNPVPEK